MLLENFAFIKTKYFPGLSFFNLLLAGLCCSLILGCPPPATDTPSPPVPRASFTLINNQIDDYIMPGKPFNLALVMDIYNGQLSTYDFSISYDPTQIDLNLNSGNQVVVPGKDGFVTNIANYIDLSEATLRITGSQTPGMGPGKQLILLVSNWIVKDHANIGTTEIKVKANQLLTNKEMPFSAPDATSLSFTIKEPEYYKLAGHVLDSIGGSPVGDTQVNLAGTGGSNHQAKTDEQGYFEFNDIARGVYDLLTNKAGQAGSRLQQVYVEENKSDYEIIQPHYGAQPEATEPPVISLSGLSREEVYSGLVPLAIAVQAGSCPVQATEFHASVYLKLGLTDMSYLQVAKSNVDNLAYTINTTLFPSGLINVKVVAYDINNNRCELNLPVKFSGSLGQVPSVAPTNDDYYIEADTYNKSLDIMRSLLAPPPSSSGKSLAPSLLLPDTTILVNFEVAKYYHGVAIYKSATEDGDFTLIGQTSDDQSGAYKFIDYAPTLEPGTTVYYKLAYFNQYGTGPQTEVIPVYILPKYSLSLVSPANHSFVTGSTATLSWTCNPYLTDKGVHRTDWIMMYNTLDATLVIYTFAVDQNNLTISDLFYNNQYEWNVRSVYEFINSKGNTNVVSHSYPSGQGAYDMSSNGGFYFIAKEP